MTPEVEFGFDAGIEESSQSLIGLSGPTLLAEMFVLVSEEGAQSKLLSFPPPVNGEVSF